MSYINTNDNTDSRHSQEKKSLRPICSLYMITHLIVSFFAFYLSYRCNNGFDMLSFLAALFCPYFYIIWALAVKGGCGMFDDLDGPSATPTFIIPK
jgi:hypothetical protein